MGLLVLATHSDDDEPLYTKHLLGSAKSWSIKVM
jgi:hypothetical protein